MKVEARIRILASHIAIEEQTQQRFFDENRWSPVYWINHWHSGLERPDGKRYAQAREWLEQADEQIAQGDFKQAELKIKEAEAASRAARQTWQRYLEGTIRSTEAGADLAKSVGKGVLAAEVAGGLGLAAAATGVAAAAAGKLAALLTRAGAALTSSAYWTRFAKLGGTSAAIRGAYDAVDATVMDNPKEPETVAKNAAHAFIGGGLCGGPFAGLLAYNYVSFDVLGDFSQRYLTDIREKQGDEKGFALGGGLLAAETALATTAFVPYLGTWGRAAKTALTATTISVGLETYLQTANGKTLAEIDPGRFVGMSAWGHAIVVLPEAILSGASAAVGLNQAVGRAVELGAKYLVFVNPSVNNFSARVNRQNWLNVQMGSTTRHATVMMFSRYIQSALRPSHPLAMVADEALGGASIALANKIWPVYEDIPGFESKPIEPPVVAKTHSSTLSSFPEGNGPAFFTAMKF